MSSPLGQFNFDPLGVSLEYSEVGIRALQKLPLGSQYEWIARILAAGMVAMSNEAEQQFW